jgi:ABC-type polysaccharide/polyol phosphate export permease
MFQAGRSHSRPAGGARLAQLVYHGAVRQVRRSDGNALVGLLMNMAQAAAFLAALYATFTLLGMRGAALRGDFMLFLMSGIFPFLTFNKTMAAVLGSEGPASPMMLHAPMNTVVAIGGAALGALYVQMLSILFLGFVYHAAVAPIRIEAPAGAIAMLLVSWFSGLSAGIVLLALKPWIPRGVGIISAIYQRLNMFASGKMFVANALPGTLLALFDWNPLFHVIDQARGFVFINYNPHFTSVAYPVCVSAVVLAVGLMGEFHTRKHASKSWYARR